MRYSHGPFCAGEELHSGSFRWLRQLESRVPLGLSQLTTLPLMGHHPQQMERRRSGEREERRGEEEREERREGREERRRSGEREERREGREERRRRGEREERRGEEEEREERREISGSRERWRMFLLIGL